MKLQWVIIVLLFCACKKDRLIPEVTEILSDYISENTEFPVVSDSLIACALGGSDVLLTSGSHPISILFYPKENASEFLYFETDSISLDPSKLEHYKLMDLEDQAIFNGYLRKFEREESDKEKWGIVTYLRNGEIHISNPIRIKFTSKPTEDNEDLADIDLSQPLAPLFTWQDGIIDENKIYFHVISDKSGDLLSGTYSFEKSFRFYDLSNVVLNIRDINPPPVLLPDETYSFVLMGVSEDNWVNLILEKEFTTQ